MKTKANRNTVARRGLFALAVLGALITFVLTVLHTLEPMTTRNLFLICLAVMIGRSFIPVSQAQGW